MISDPKAPEIIKFSWADEVLRRDGDRQLDDPVEIDMGLSPSQVAAALDYQRPTAG